MSVLLGGEGGKMRRVSIVPPMGSLEARLASCGDGCAVGPAVEC